MSHRDPAAGITRRALLGGTATVGLAALVAACGGGGDGGQQSEPTGPVDAAEPGGGPQALGGEPVEVWRDPG